MAGYKETPRQKMIAMMYLVLTALLALNVSREILSAFITVNESMETTTKQFAKKVDDIYADFEKQYTINPTKVGDYWDKAKGVRQLSNNMVDYINKLKTDVIAYTEKISTAEADTIHLKWVTKKDNYDDPTNFFLGNETKKGEADNLLERISNYKQQLLTYISEPDRANFDLGLKTNGDYRNADGKAESWQVHHFYRTILAADITILNKTIAEVYNAETNVVNYLYSSITAEDFKFNQVSAKVISKSNYVFQGEDYQAEILVAAYDTAQNPDVYVLEGADTLTEAMIDRAKKIEGSGGRVKLELPASSEGTKKYAGIIRMLTPWGTTKDYHFKSEYIVAKPSASISPTKMNVFYRGVDNPVAIAASGKAEAQLHPEISAGKIIKSDTGWVVNSLPSDAYQTIIKIYADDMGGKKFMGQQLFRVKRLPDPIARVVGAVDGQISGRKLLTNPFLICSLPESVDFKYDFKVTSFTMIVPTGSGQYVSTEKAESMMFTDKMKSLIGSLKKDDILIFRDIKVKSPEGSRKIESINIQIN